MKNTTDKRLDDLTAAEEKQVYEEELAAVLNGTFEA